MKNRMDVARALRATWGEKTGWDTLSPKRQQPWLEMADAAIEAMEEKGKVVNDWRWVLKRSHSVKFGVTVSALLSLLVGNFDIVFSVLSQAPPELRMFIPLPLFAVLAATALWLRVKRQDRK
jgi:hypothetical protein